MAPDPTDAAKITPEALKALPRCPVCGEQPASRDVTTWDRACIQCSDMDHTFRVYADTLPEAVALWKKAAIAAEKARTTP